MYILDSNNVISDALENAFGIAGYLDIIDTVKSSDFSATPEFIKKFNAFYKVRQKSKDWYDYYYSLMEQQRQRQRTFEEVLRELYKKGSLEVSFASKLISAVNPALPIWDQYVVRNLGYEKEWERYRYKSPEERIMKAVEVYEGICGWYADFLSSGTGKNCIAEFNKALPKYKDKLTNVKKIDFLLWSKR